MGLYPKPWQPTGSGSYREVRKGAFELSWRPSGSRGPKLRRVVDCTAKEARAFLLREGADRSRAGLGLPSNLSWDDAIAMYSERLDAKGVVARYKADVLERLEDLRQFAPTLQHVEPHSIQSWLDAIAKNLKKDKRAGWARTANLHRSMVSGFFRYLVRMRKLQYNPVSATFEFPETIKPPRNVSPQDYARVWEISEPSVRDCMDFSLITACRFSEMAEAKHADIVNGVWTIKDRKGHDYLKLALPPEILAIVQRQPKTEDGLIFHKWVPRKQGSDAGHGFNPGEPMDRTWWREVIAQRCNQIQGLVRFKPHDLRHAAATWARAAGLSPWFIQNLLGHSTIKTTEIYAAKDLSGAEKVSLALMKIRDEAISKLKQTS